MLDDIVEWATALVEALGPLGVGFLVVLENLSPPIPSEVVLPMAGFVAATGGADLTVMIAAATIGSLVGAYLSTASPQPSVRCVFVASSPNTDVGLGSPRMTSIDRRHGSMVERTERSCSVAASP